MAAVLDSNGRNWTRWFAGPAPVHGWRVLRFEKVNADGSPVGKPVESLTPSNNPRRFASELSAQGVADWLNAEEGR